MPALLDQPLLSFAQEDVPASPRRPAAISRLPSESVLSSAKPYSVTPAAEADDAARCERLRSLRVAMAPSGLTRLGHQSMASVVDRGVAGWIEQLGLCQGGVVELTPDGPEAESACLAMASELVRQQPVRADESRRCTLWIDRPAGRHLFGCGRESGGDVVLRPSSDADTWWACEQAARCPAVAAVVARIGRSAGGDVAARRLKLAQESGGGLVLLVHPPGRQGGGACWSDLRVSVRYAAPGPGGLLPLVWQPRWEAEVLYRPGGLAGERLVLEQPTAEELPTPDDLLTGDQPDTTRTHTTQTKEIQRDGHPLPLAAELADPTGASRADRTTSPAWTDDPMRQASVPEIPQTIDRRLRRPVRRSQRQQPVVGRPA